MSATEDAEQFMPLLSVIVPVYNGSKKLERTLEKVQAKLDQLESVMWNVEVERAKVEHSLLTTGQFPEANAPKVTAVAQERLVIYAGGMGATNIAVPSGPAASETTPSPSGFRKWYELIVVNDGSRDNTRSVIDKVCQADDRIRSISYSVNQGKGYAIKQGVLHSTGRYVLFMDGDGEISADVLAKYLQKLSKSHIVIGSKHHSRSVVKAPLSRRLLSKCFQIYARKSLGLSVHDTQVGLKAGRGEVFRKIFGRVQVKRYAFDAEMLAIAKLMDVKVVELPVKIELEKSFKKKEIVRMAIDVLGVAFRLRVIKWYQKNMEKKRPQYRLPLIF